MNTYYLPTLPVLTQSGTQKWFKYLYS